MSKQDDHRRNAERHRVRFHLVYDDGASFNAGTVRDVSEGGLFLQTPLPLPVGTEVRLTPLDHSGGHLFEVRARVARSIPYDPDAPLDQPAGMGLQFVGLSQEERVSVVAMINALQARAASFHGERDPFLGIMVPAGRGSFRPSSLPAPATPAAAKPSSPPEGGTPDKS